MEVKITGGSFRGKKLSVSDSLKKEAQESSAGLRPITSRMKQMLFDLLQEYTPNSLFVDLYAGTGVVGLEALSRGANRAIFIDNNAKLSALISKNLHSLNLTTKGTVLTSELPSYLENKEFNELLKLQSPHERYRIIFADPPYSQIAKFPLRQLTKFVDEETIVVIKAPAEIESQQSRRKNLRQDDRFKYQQKVGKNSLYFYY